MLEAVLWFSGFILLLTLTWFAGKHYGEKIALRRAMQQRSFKDADFFNSPLDQLLTVATKDRTTKGGARLYLAAKDGDILAAPQQDLLKQRRLRH